MTAIHSSPHALDTSHRGVRGSPGIDGGSTGEGVTYLCELERCMRVFVCILDYHRPGASGEAAPRSGRAVVIHQWDVTKQNFTGAAAKVTGRRLSRDRTGHWRIARQRT